MKQKDYKLEEVRSIIHNREPSLQELDWIAWLANPLNQKLADLDIERAIRMLPAATDTETQAQAKIARMKEFLTIQYLTSIRGTPAFPEHGPPGMDVFDNPSLQEMYPGLGNRNRGDLRIEGLWGNTPPTTTEEVR